MLLTKRLLSDWTALQSIVSKPFNSNLKKNFSPTTLHSCYMKVAPNQNLVNFCCRKILRQLRLNMLNCILYITTLIKFIIQVFLIYIYFFNYRLKSKDLTEELKRTCRFRFPEDRLCNITVICKFGGKRLYTVRRRQPLQIACRTHD